MDHAAWVQRNIAAVKKQRSDAKPRRNSRGRVVGWHAAPEVLSPFQASVMNILGIVGGGIYNAPINWETMEWSWGDGLSLAWENSLSTFDFQSLTGLVFLCHDARIRCTIEPCGPRLLRLSFWQRSHDGGSNVRHPSLEEAVASHRGEVSLAHPLIYRPVAAEADPEPNIQRTVA